MYARLEYNPLHSWEVKLALYTSKASAKADPCYAILELPLTNEQLSELVFVAKIKPVNIEEMI